MKIKGPKDKTMLSIVALLLCSIQFVASQSATSGSTTTDMVIDYDDVHKLFTTEEELGSSTTEEELGSPTTARSPTTEEETRSPTTTQLCSTALSTESGSGSNDLLQPENCITGNTDLTTGTTDLTTGTTDVTPTDVTLTDVTSVDGGSK